jgi:hypothetical protein
MAHVFTCNSFLSDPTVRKGNKNLVTLQIIRSYITWVGNSFNNVTLIKMSDCSFRNCASQNSCNAPESEVSSFLGQNLMNSGLISGLGTEMSHKIPARPLSPKFLHSWVKT